MKEPLWPFWFISRGLTTTSCPREEFPLPPPRGSCPLWRRVSVSLGDWKRQCWALPIQDPQRHAPRSRGLAGEDSHVWACWRQGFGTVTGLLAVPFLWRAGLWGHILISAACPFFPSVQSYKTQWDDERYPFCLEWLVCWWGDCVRKKQGRRGSRLSERTGRKVAPSRLVNMMPEGKRGEKYWDFFALVFYKSLS